MLTIPQPLADWLEGQTGLALVLTMLGIWGLLWGLWRAAKTAFPSIKHTIRLIESLSKLPEFMATTTGTLEEQGQLLRDVKHEVMPNHGSSLRDEHVTTALRLEKVEAKMSKDYERVDAIEDELRLRELRGIGIPRSTVSPRLNAHLSRRYRNAPSPDLEDTEYLPDRKE